MAFRSRRNARRLATQIVTALHLRPPSQSSRPGVGPFGFGVGPMNVLQTVRHCLILIRGVRSSFSGRIVGMSDIDLKHTTECRRCVFPYACAEEWCHCEEIDLARALADPDVPATFGADYQNRPSVSAHTPHLISTRISGLLGRLDRPDLHTPRGRPSRGPECKPRTDDVEASRWSSAPISPYYPAREVWERWPAHPPYSTREQDRNLVARSRKAVERSCLQLEKPRTMAIEDLCRGQMHLPKNVS
jgi:hypothetical protein